ncbi:MAG: hypothetical protein MUE53_06050, partial [Chitinophagales bacterium]|nr:hypothetical protein [Chitinophagales bacterium]
MRYFFLFFIAISVSLQAQQSKAIVDLAVPEAYTFKLTALEKEMYLHARKMIDDTIEKSRLNHCYELIKTLKTALKIPNSFYHDFSDTIPGMIELRSPDNRFKMFTIQLEGRNTQYRHFGAIQFASSELKFLPLIDYSDTFDLTPQIPLNQKNWYGSLYYKAIPKQIGKKTIYFLLGYDKNNYFSSKKIVEPLEIISEREVLFGGLYFNLNTNLNQDEKSDLTPKNMMKNDKAKGTFPKTKGETKTKEV